MKINEIINLKELKKYLTKGYGKQGKCKEKAYGCPACMAWWVYRIIEEFVEHIKSMEDIK